MNKGKIKSHLRGRYAEEINILSDAGFVNGAANCGGYKQIRLFLVESHIVRDRIRKDVVTRSPVVIPVDRKRQFLIREDQLLARYNLS